MRRICGIMRPAPALHDLAMVRRGLCGVVKAPWSSVLAAHCTPHQPSSLEGALALLHQCAGAHLPMLTRLTHRTAGRCGQRAATSRCCACRRRCRLARRRTRARLAIQGLRLKCGSTAARKMHARLRLRRDEEAKMSPSSAGAGAPDLRSDVRTGGMVLLRRVDSHPLSLPSLDV